MFDQFRDSLRALSDRLAPEERRRVVSSMRDAMVHAKLGVQDLRSGIAVTETRLATERTELDTVRRRLGLAAQIGDSETVAVAERFATQHAERVAVLESKLMVQQQELTMTERELDEMSSQLRMAASGIAPGGVSADVQAERELEAFIAGAADSANAKDGSAAFAGRDDVSLGGTFSGGSTPGDASGSGASARRSRAEREAEAEERLAALKRRMGK